MHKSFSGSKIYMLCTQGKKRSYLEDKELELSSSICDSISSKTLLQNISK